MGLSTAMDEIIDMTKGKFDYIYVASSWRNPLHTAVVAALRAAGQPCYDFKHDEGAQFNWSEVGVASGGEKYERYIDGLTHPRSEEGFASDFGAMQRADACIMVLPCGRSAHLEAGWFIGEGKPTCIFMAPEPDGSYTPELMYKMADHITNDFMDLLAWVGIED